MKKSKLLLISGIIGTLYLIYLIYYFADANVSSSGSEAIGAGIATMLVAPHAVLAGIALVFNWLGFFLNVKWAALVAGILYAVAMVLFIMYFMFVIVEMILCFIAYSKMKKNEAQ